MDSQSRTGVGASAVEVLDVGEPPPRVLLRVSCPIDQLPRGRALAVTLHCREQPAARGSPRIGRVATSRRCAASG